MFICQEKKETKGRARLQLPWKAGAVHGGRFQKQREAVESGWKLVGSPGSDARSLSPNGAVFSAVTSAAKR